MHEFNVVRAFKLLSERQQLIADFKTPPPKEEKDGRETTFPQMIYTRPMRSRELIPGDIKRIELELTFLGIVYEPVELDLTKADNA